VGKRGEREMNERIKELALQAGFDDFPNDENGIWITDGYWNIEIERFYEMAFEAGRMYGIQQSPAEPVRQAEVKMNEKEIREEFDREYKKHIKDIDETNFVKFKKPTYYIATHSDEDLQAAVLAMQTEYKKLHKVNQQIISALQNILSMADCSGDKAIFSEALSALKKATE
jgi:hypothetical protein